VALRRLKTAASAVDKDVMAGVQTPFLQVPPAMPAGWGDGARNCSCSQRLQRVSECDGRHRRL